MAAIGVFGTILRALRDFCYPPRCLLCDAPPEDGDGLLCRGCHDALASRTRGYHAPERSLPGIDRILVMLPYDASSRTLVHALKYHNRPAAGLLLGDLMGRAATASGVVSPDICLVPVPLHPGKLASRGYNQSERLAAGFAMFTGLPVDASLLVRTRDTGTQTALDQDARVANVQGAFRYAGERSLAGAPVMLIDDVLTTGSTIAECARVLREGGAGSVTVAVVATPDHGAD